jgi:hypothetical protein
METWQSIKQRLDALNLTHINTKTDNIGMPIIEKQSHKVEGLTPFNNKPKHYAHFFLDDYRFEKVWNKPKKYLNILNEFDGVLSPDFSLYTDYPLPVQIWNTYRNRWLGQYWQQHGIKVIPTIVWSTKDSYDFCFKGVETGCDVAISSIGIMKNENALNLFYEGYTEMLKQIKPNKIYLYGYKCPLDIDVIFIENRRFK